MRELIFYLYAIPVPFRRILIHFIVIPLTALFNQRSCIYQLTKFT
jgi:hypothetical protein